MELFYNIASVLHFGFLAMRHVGPRDGTQYALESKALTTRRPGKFLAILIYFVLFSFYWYEVYIM